MALKLRLDSMDESPEEKKAELTEHLAELRTRIIRACLYAAVGMVVMYFFSKPIYGFLSAPIEGYIQKLKGSGFRFNSFTEPFFLKLQISMVGGLILAAPLIILELWGFVAPALTPGEKRAAHLVAPLSVVLFLLGAGCAYLILPMAVRWFLGYMTDFPNPVLLQNPLQYVVFVVKMLLVFGLIFQLPVVLMFFGRIGLITSSLMVTYWRQIAVGLFTVAMIVAPSNDPGTMLALAIPLTLLFFGSIWLVKLVEPKNKDE